MAGQVKVPPFTLIATPPEGELLAGFVERYAKATCERVLPSLDLTFEERQELVSQDLDLREQIQKEPWKYNIGAGEYGEYASPEAMIDYGLDSVLYAEMEVSALRMHILGLAFAGLFHIFERQLLMILYRLEHRRRNTFFELVHEKERHTFSGYKKLLEIGSYPITGAIGTDVERLRLIANVMKHGSRHSLRTLKKEFPDLFWQGSPTVSIDNMQLNIGLLIESASSIASFWRDFPVS
jgi:hypothetical protein